MTSMVDCQLSFLQSCRKYCDIREIENMSQVERVLLHVRGIKHVFLQHKGDIKRQELVRDKPRCWTTNHMPEKLIL